MARGRRSEPTALKVVKGARADRINHNEPARIGALSEEPPAWMPELAQDFWREYAPLLNEMGVAGSQDAAILEVASCTYAVWREKMHQTTLIAQVRGLLASIGLDPSNRSKFVVPQKSEMSPLEAHLRAKGL